ncbi:hypothetical protein FKM82_027628 [Ascaphus truei]
MAPEPALWKDMKDFLPFCVCRKGLCGNRSCSCQWVGNTFIRAENPKPKLASLGKKLSKASLCRKLSAFHTPGAASTHSVSYEVIRLQLVKENGK